MSRRPRFGEDGPQIEPTVAAAYRDFLIVRAPLAGSLALYNFDAGAGERTGTPARFFGAGEDQHITFCCAHQL